MIPAECDKFRIAADDLTGCTCDRGHGVFNGSGNDGDIPIIYNLQFFEWGDIQRCVMSPDHQRRLPNFSWPEARPRTIGCAAVERYTQYRNIHTFQLP